MNKTLMRCFTLLIVSSWYWWGNDLLIVLENSSPSNIRDNRIEDGKRLPVQGVNFKSYSRFWSLMGRTHVHHSVREVMLTVYRHLEVLCPGVIFIYGETGWKHGGNFWPHRTHRSGLSVDFMVPVLNKTTHEPTYLSTYPWTLYGYQTRFDAQGVSSNYRINFFALIEHLAALDQACRSHSLRIKRVILDPPLQNSLYHQHNYEKIKNMPFLKDHAWFPHDGHYHIDFELIAPPLKK